MPLENNISIIQVMFYAHDIGYAIDYTFRT